jgi:hypothetical protein
VYNWNIGHSNRGVSGVLHLTHARGWGQTSGGWDHGIDELCIPSHEPFVLCFVQGQTDVKE